MSNLATSMMADIIVYTNKLRGWSKFIWCILSPQKWWVHGYELGWKSALNFMKPKCDTCINASFCDPHRVGGILAVVCGNYKEDTNVM
jgi:hypothetical protein